MDVDPRVEDLTEEDADGENSSEEPLTGSSSGSDSGSSSLYDDGRQMFLSVPVIDVDEYPSENDKPIPIPGPSVARSMVMLPGPSVLTSLILIEDAIDLNNDVRFIPPHYRGGEAGPDVDPQEEVKEEELEGKVAGTPEFWADYD
jgi:hypothetical protein